MKVGSEAHEKVVNFLKEPQISGFAVNAFLQISTLFVFAVNCSRHIRATKHMRVATINWKTESVKICKIAFSCKYQNVSEYDQEIPQSHTADQPMAP